MSPPSQIGGRGQGGVAAAIGGGGEAQRPGGRCDTAAGTPPRHRPVVCRRW
jgi:hypothetical protein